MKNKQKFLKETLNNILLKIPKIPKIPKIHIYIKSLAVFLLVFLLIYIYIFFNIENIEKKIIFPWWGKELSNNTITLQNIEEINVKIADWSIINGIYLWDWKGKTVFYFPWNSWPLQDFYEEIEYIHWLWVNVIAYNYPWYGKSSWIISQNNLAQYSQIFFRDLQNKKNIKNEDLIIWWRNIWSAIAADFAGRNTFDKIIMISPFTSAYDISTKIFGFPIQKLFFKKNTFNTIDTVQYFSQSALIIHGNNDQIIPFQQWKEIYNNFASKNNKWNNKYFIELDSFWHNWIISKYWIALESKLLDFLNSWDIQSENNILKITLENINHWVDATVAHKNIFNADLESDISITKFVNSDISFNDKTYIPDNLVSFSSDYIADGKWYWVLRDVLIAELEDLWKAFYEEFWRKLLINSSYRSYAYQQGIKNRWCPDNLCAKAGYSEHQSWLWFDIFAIETYNYWKNNDRLWSYYVWLDEHAHKYGFHNTYQKWLDIDWYEIEPWHWRYLWVDLASYLSEKDITIAEFYYQQKKND